jgi:hypothetical protein
MHARSYHVFIIKHSSYLLVTMQLIGNAKYNNV